MNYLRLIFCLILLAFPAASLAGRTPDLAIATIESSLDDGVYLLDINLDVVLGDSLLEALSSGLKLVFKVEIEILTPHRWRPNEVVAALAQRYQLTYRSLAQRYVVKNINTDSQETFSTLDEAMSFLRYIGHLPVIDADLVDPDKVYGRMRVMVDASYLPLPLRVRALTSKVWGASSRWMRWSLE